jgi:hypothetical protein
LKCYQKTLSFSENSATRNSKTATSNNSSKSKKNGTISEEPRNSKTEKAKTQITALKISNPQNPSRLLLLIKPPRKSSFPYNS